MDDSDAGSPNHCQVGGLSFYHISSFRFCGLNKEAVLLLKGEKNPAVHESNATYYSGTTIIFDSRISKLY